MMNAELSPSPPWGSTEESVGEEEEIEDEGSDDELSEEGVSEELGFVETLLKLSLELGFSDCSDSLEIDEISIFEEGSADIFEFSILEVPPAAHDPSNAAKDKANK